MEERKEKSKLLLIAIIVALVLWVGLFTTGVILNNMAKKYIPDIEQAWGKLTDEEREKWTGTIGDPNYYKETLKKEQRNLLICFGIDLLVLAIPTVLAVIGKKKNKRKMILAAGIVYIFTGVGIPSSVLCFIANAKMKKQE